MVKSTKTNTEQQKQSKKSHLIKKTEQTENHSGLDSELCRKFERAMSLNTQGLNSGPTSLAKHYHSCLSQQLTYKRNMEVTITDLEPSDEIAGQCEEIDMKNTGEEEKEKPTQFRQQMPKWQREIEGLEEWRECQ